MTFEETIGKIKKGGYWEISMKPGPGTYDKERFKFDELENLVRTNQVKRRGVPFPYLTDAESQGKYYPRGTYLESFTSIIHLSAFRFYQSGQFVEYLWMLEDAQDASASMFGPHDPQRGKKFMSPLACIYQLTEAFLFASRLAAKDVFRDRAIVEIKLHGLAGRVLNYSDPRRFPFYTEYPCEADTVSFDCEKTPQELQAEHDELAVEACVKILAYFKFSPKHVLDRVKSDQQDFYNGVLV